MEQAKQRLRSVIEGQMSSPTAKSGMMSYCIIRSKLQRAKDEDGKLAVASQAKLDSVDKLVRLPLAGPTRATAPLSFASQTPAITSNEDNRAGSSQFRQHLHPKPAPSCKTTTTTTLSITSCHSTSPGSYTKNQEVVDTSNDQQLKDNAPSKSARRCTSSSARGKVALSPLNWSYLWTLAFLCTCLVDWRPEYGVRDNDKNNQQQTNSFYSFMFNSFVEFTAPTRNYLSRRGVQMAEAQYRPDWPSKLVQQEIFLLNLEDGYFGCQVNESQDFLQLFELSKLCDGQTQCYLGTDEMTGPLKCSERDRCGSYQNSRGQQESVQCVNGVCLDGLCYCNDGFGGKSCDVPDENECKFRPCDVFAHCTNTMGSYYCSCFPGKSHDLSLQKETASSQSCRSFMMMPAQ